MDPNETTQKLLQLDTFHEVRRKRDRRKENQNKEPAELKWKPGAQARPSRAGRGNYSSRYASNDTGGGRNSATVKESTVSHLPDKGSSKAPLVTPQDIQKNAASSNASSITDVSNGPSGVATKNASVTYDNHASSLEGIDPSTKSGSMHKLEGPLLLQSPADSVENSKVLGTKDEQQHKMLESRNSQARASGCSFSSDPVLPSSQDSPLSSGVVGTSQHEAGSQDGTAELIDSTPDSQLSSAKISISEDGISNLQKVPNDVPVAGKNQHSEPMQVSSSGVGVSTGSRPSSNYNNRPQVIGSQKVSTGKEWKPKSTTVNNGQGASTAASAEISTASVGSHPDAQTTLPIVSNLKEATLELPRKLEEVHILDSSQHVIIPNHLHVPEVAKLGFCFGSFDASFGFEINQNGVPGSENSLPMSESTEVIDGPVKELQLSNASEVATSKKTETKYPDHNHLPPQETENFAPNEGEVSSSAPSDYNESKPEAAPGSQQQTVVPASSAYNLGYMPPIVSGQLASSEILETQARDAPRLPGIIVPQSFDPASYYAQFYRSGVDSDGRISPFLPAGGTNKYNGNAALISAQTSQTPQELQGGVPLVLSTASPPPLVTQAAGVMQSSATQQPLPVFRQPTGVHIPHYPPNYLPYPPYFSPYYVPPPTIHQFLSNGAFPQQPQVGNLFPSAPGTNAKFSASQYKQGSNTGGPAPVGLPGSYGPYGLSMANYASSSAAAPVTSTSTEDIGASQIKENNIYIGGQQNEGSGVWFTTPNRDISTLTASSFYNVPQGQLAFTPTQPGHGTFTGIFHPAQAVTAANVHPLLQQSQAITNAADMVGPTASVYQQPQHAQLNWPSNY